MERTQIAMLMDFENLVIGFESNGLDPHRNFSVRNILEYVEKSYGRVAYKKAFADWSNAKFKRFSFDLMRNGVEMQHIVHGGYTKNHMASYMTIQAMDCLARTPEIGTFILVTGDADFLPLISYIKSTGREVIGLGTEGTVSNILLSSCDDFIFYGQDGLNKNTKPFTDKGAVIRHIKGIIGSSSIDIDKLEDSLLNEMPDFAAEDYGFDDILSFIESMPNTFKLTDTDNTVLVSNLYPAGRQTRPAKSETQQVDVSSLPLDKYMKETRWFIENGTLREEVLTNIFDVLSEYGKPLTNDMLRQETCNDLDIDDKAWQGTIYSLVCGSCLWEKPDSPDLPSHLRRVSLFKNIHEVDEFMQGYYTSLFHKAFMERQDLNAQTMAELMHPEDVEGHLALFQKVYDSFFAKKQSNQE